MRHLGTKPLETPRLLLRPLAEADAPHMLRNWAGDCEVTKFLTWPPHADERVTLEYIRSIGYANPEVYSWGIELRELSQVIGTIGVGSHKNELDLAHLGYCMGREWWGGGIMAEALSAVLRFLFEEVGANRVEAMHDTRNPNSGRVMQKCGMICEGVLRQSGKSNAGIGDMAWYSILREDYVK